MNIEFRILNLRLWVLWSVVAFALAGLQIMNRWKKKKSKNFLKKKNDPANVTKAHLKETKINPGVY